MRLSIFRYRRGLRTRGASPRAARHPSKFLLVLLFAAQAWGTNHSSAQTLLPAHANVCRLIEQNAAATRLPVDYLARLLWTESRFDPWATSPAGAQGIAQFMPQTAADEGLADPRNPTSSVQHAAQLLV